MQNLSKILLLANFFFTKHQIFQLDEYDSNEDDEEEEEMGNRLSAPANRLTAPSAAKGFKMEVMEF